jgi:hypothetical protein
MSRSQSCRIGATPADYQRYGIAKDQIVAREDGFRTRPGGPGTFEGSCANFVVVVTQGGG